MRLGSSCISLEARLYCRAPGTRSLFCTPIVLNARKMKQCRVIHLAICLSNLRNLDSQVDDCAPVWNVCDQAMMLCPCRGSQTSKPRLVEKTLHDFLLGRSCCWEDAARTGKTKDCKNNIKTTFSRKYINLAPNISTTTSEECLDGDYSCFTPKPLDMFQYTSVSTQVRKRTGGTRTV